MVHEMQNSYTNDVPSPFIWIYVLIYTLGHKLETTKFEMENIFYISLFAC